ncbi:MAG: hypothetical protein HKN26_07620 [Acidimicrobiales bacterium]|nr:hypothetical protein [Acidimicrobiales bacterium]
MRARVGLGRLHTLAMRHRLGRRSLAIALAVLAGWSVAVAQAQAHETVERWGRTVPVMVAVNDVPLGHVLSLDDVEVSPWPVGLVPAAIAEFDRDDLVGRTVTAAIAAGEPIHPVRLAPVGLGGLAALLPPATNGVAIDRSDVSIAVEVGNRVDLGTISIDGDARPLATGLLVVAVGDQNLTVAVPTERSAEVALAAMRNEVTVSLRGGS